MRTLAIGDIHGCLTALETLLRVVDVQPEDQIITLGDYVDRGPDSRGVLELLISLWQQKQLIAIRGNHDVMMCKARRKRSTMANWLALGGDATLKSYKGTPGVPDEHWNFLEHTLVNYYETASHIYVHAGLLPDVTLVEQPEFVLHFHRFGNPAPHYSGKTMICGHTAQKSGVPKVKERAICLDTKAHSGGWLSCLHVESGQLWQANQKGEVRQMHLEDAGKFAHSA